MGIYPGRAAYLSAIVASTGRMTSRSSSFVKLPASGLRSSTEVTSGPMPARDGSWWKRKRTLRGPGRQAPVLNFLGASPATISSRHHPRAASAELREETNHPISNLNRDSARAHATKTHKS